MRVCLTIGALWLFVLCTTAQAAYHGWYIGGAVSYLFQADSDNSGTTGAFTAGAGTDLEVAARTPYSWETEFDDGWGLSGEIGKMFVEGWRLAIELNYTSADVDKHSGVLLGGTDIGSQDAALLVPGSTEPLGVSVEQVWLTARVIYRLSAYSLTAITISIKRARFSPMWGWVSALSWLMWSLSRRE